MPSVYCTQCGHANPDDARFCSNCGTPLTRSVPPVMGDPGDSTSTVSLGAVDAADGEPGDELTADHAGVEALPPNSRAVILLHYIAGMSLSAAAAAMDVPEGTAKSRLAYALSLLRRATGDPP